MATKEDTPTKTPQSEHVKDNNDHDKPKMERAGTMQVTAEEGKEFIGEQALEKTRGATALLQEGIKQSENDKDSDENDDDKPSLPRSTTIQATTEEAKGILGEEVREKTRKQTREERASGSSQENDKDKASLQRTTTIAATTQEGAVLLGEESLGKTRSQTQKAQTPTKAVKRTSTAALANSDGDEISKKAKTDSSSDDQNPEPVQVSSES